MNEESLSRLKNLFTEIKPISFKLFIPDAMSGYCSKYDGDVILSFFLHAYRYNQHEFESEHPCSVFTRRINCQQLIWSVFPMLIIVAGAGSHLFYYNHNYVYS